MSLTNTFKPQANPASALNGFPSATMGGKPSPFMMTAISFGQGGIEEMALKAGNVNIVKPGQASVQKPASKVKPPILKR